MQRGPVAEFFRRVAWSALGTGRMGMRKGRGPGAGNSERRGGRADGVTGALKAWAGMQLAGEQGTRRRRRKARWRDRLYPRGSLK